MDRIETRRRGERGGLRGELYISEREKQLLFDLTRPGTSNPLNIADSFTDSPGLIRADHYQEFSSMLALWTGFKGSPQCAEALVAVDPLLAQLATLEAKAEREAEALDDPSVEAAEAAPGPPVDWRGL